MNPARVCSLLCALSAVLYGCPSDDGGGGSDGGGATSGLGEGAWDPVSCTPMAQMQTLPGSCTQADFDTWNECLIDACQDQFTACYGPNYQTGTYSGACQPFIECAVACQCNDASCTAACPGAQACSDCLQMNLCGGDCKLDCAYTGTGIDTTKTCDDLLRCCSGLRDAENRQQCADSARMLDQIPGGDASCASLYQLYTISSTCL